MPLLALGSIHEHGHAIEPQLHSLSRVVLIRSTDTQFGWYSIHLTLKRGRKALYILENLKGGSVLPTAWRALIWGDPGLAEVSWGRLLCTNATESNRVSRGR